MNNERLTTLLMVLCSLLAVANVAFLLSEWNEPSQDRNMPVMILKGKEQPAKEEVMIGVYPKSVNMMWDGTEADDNGSVMALIGALAVTAAIALAAYDFFRIRQMRDSMEELKRREDELERKTEEKYAKRIRQLEQAQEAMSTVMQKMAFVEMKLKKPNAMLNLYTSLMSYYVEKDCASSIQHFKAFIAENKKHEGFLNISLYKLYDNCGMIEQNTDEVLDILTKCLNKQCYVETSTVFEYLNDAQQDRLQKAMASYYDQLTVGELEMNKAVSKQWENLFEKCC
ncbi:hypothetical protein [Staphylospora marina]|uniref:hypothetical protein n=1 Tax=Staphylospora marina TaxID=2490858 RepID=UPI000F5BA20B|nr:hypothetical protein [Staphylospora marina]